MNACPAERELLSYLERELDALNSDWIETHVEDCRACQETLERLTSGSPALGEVSTFDAVDVDRRPKPEDTEGSGDRREVLRGDETSEAFGVGTTVDLDTDRTAPDREDDQQILGQDRSATAAHWPVIAGYEILQRLGEGGMGVVYKARHLGLNRLVALKMIRGGSQARADFFARFRVEAESVARLRHANIVQIFDIGEAGSLPFVALELLDGGGLDDRLAGNPQPGREAAGLMMTLARAVHVAHESGIIHRDLKPANVLYTSDGIPKITDFGLAKRVASDDGHTQSGQILGSPSYMAPEQARGHSRNVGPAADVYALGAMLYDMLTGRPPFKGETPMETVRQVIDDDPVTPSRLVPRIPRDLETICLKCLHKDPARRYGTAHDLAEDLERYLEGEPIRARRTPAWERAAKWARRRPAEAVAGTFLVAALVAAVAGLFARQESQLKRTRTIAAVLNDGSALEREADSAKVPRELRAVQSGISGLLPQLKGLEDDPRVKELRGRLEWKLNVVKTQLDRDESDQSRLKRLASDQGQLNDYRDLYNRAIFHLTRYTGLDLPSNQDATQRALVAALNVYAAPGAGDVWALGSMPESLSRPERDEIAEGCYELLLALSKVETSPQQGLSRLDQAARLHPTPTRAYHFRRASCLERAGESPAADRERRRAESLAVTTAFDHYLAGQERYERNEPIEAIRHFNHTLRQQPEHFWAQCLSAICWLQLHRPEAAQAGFNACLKRDPEFAWLYILRGFASSLGLRGATPEEIQLRSEPAEADYRRAMELLERRPNAELKYALLINRGVLRLQQGDHDNAGEFVQQAIELDGTHYLAHATLASVRQRQGKTDEALGLFARAIERRRDLAALYRDRAGVVLSCKSPTHGQRMQALADLDRAIRLEKPDSPLVARDHTSRGKLLAAEGRDVEAVAACEAAIERVRDDPDAHRLRLDLLLKLKRHDDVIRSCDPLIARGKATAAIYERRALAREQIRDFPGAIEDFTSAVALGGDRPKLIRLRGWVYIVADAPRLAWHDFQEAIRLDPSSADARNGRGLARLRLGEHREAVTDAERALALGEPTTDLFYKSARVYALAAIVASAEARKKGQESVLLVSRYQDRAADLLRGAIRMFPPDRRSWFVNEVILADPDLRTLRRRLTSMDLAGPISAVSKRAGGAR